MARQLPTDRNPGHHRLRGPCDPDALTVPGLALEPLLVVHGSTIPWGEHYLGGVAILPAERLVTTLFALPQLLTDLHVTQLADRAVSTRQPAA